MADFSIDVEPNAEAKALLNDGTDRLQSAQEQLIKEVTFEVQAESQRNTPEVSGDLRRSHFSDLKEIGQLRSRVRVQEVYARRVENLKGPGGIGSKGRRGPRYLRRAIQMVEPRIPGRWRKIAEGMLDRFQIG